MCMADNLNCVSQIKVNDSACLQICSGLLVTSYNQEEIEDRLSNVIDTLTMDVLLEEMTGKLQG